MNILDNFKLHKEQEDYKIVIDRIDKAVVFKGTNLWVLIFAIFIASLGLNVNSTAVIIGAMLVSPLMGPIMGLGLGMGINDLALLRKSLFNYLLAGGVGLATSTIYFLISPINDAHSEILARTSPNIYDVLIALFGGFAGIMATATKQKGNVIPGVAIATALMPPLCTAGYGLATFQFPFFFGAFYLYIINSVFIALATLFTTRFLKFPYKHLPKVSDEKRSKRIVWVVVLITITPSLYFGYDLVQQNKFLNKANSFIEYEATFPNDYLLKKEIDTKNKSITLIYGGQYIEKDQINKMKNKLPKYDLDTSVLKIRQGFAYLKEEKQNEQTNRLSLALSQKDDKIEYLQSQLDSVESQKKLSIQVFKELKIQYPYIQSCILEPVTNISTSAELQFWICNINTVKVIGKKEKKRISDWLKIRLNTDKVQVNSILVKPQKK